MSMKKITMKTGKRSYIFKCDSSFWYNYDDGEQLRIFIDNNGIWVGKYITNKDGSSIWQRLTNYELIFDEGTLKFK